MQRGMVSLPSCFQQHHKMYSSPFVSLGSQSATTDLNLHHSPQYLLLFISLSALLLLFIAVFDLVGGGVISDTGTSPGIRSLRTQGIPPKNTWGVASAQSFSLESVYKAVVTLRSFSWGGTLLSQMAEKLLWLLLKWLIAFSHCRFASVGKKLP